MKLINLIARFLRGLESFAEVLRKEQRSRKNRIRKHVATARRITQYRRARVIAIWKSRPQ